MANIRWNLRVASHARRKLTPENVEDIQRRYATGELIASIHRSYPQVCESTIEDVGKGNTWRGVGMSWGGKAQG